MMFDIFIYIFSFIFIISILVFVHEYGHYIVAKLFKVKILEFSLGFGKELWGKDLKSGERFKICMLPLGGYVKMYGDESAASSNSEKIYDLSKEERQDTFFFKPLWQKFLIVLAGPLANYLFAFVILVYVFSFHGKLYNLPEITKIYPDTPAAAAGLQTGDVIKEISGKKIRDFSDVREMILINPEVTLDVLIKRQESELMLKITPAAKQSEDDFGGKNRVGFLGVASDKVEYRKVNILTAIPRSAQELYDMSYLTLVALKQIILGQRSLSDLSGPVRIAKYSGDVTKQALTPRDGQIKIVLLFWFMAMISMNLGLVNLLPIPLLDGGHLFFYIIEFIKGKPLPIKVQEYVYKASMVFLLMIFSFVIVSDINIVFFN